MRGFLAACRRWLPALLLGAAGATGSVPGTVSPGWAQPVLSAAPGDEDNELSPVVVDLWRRVGACGTPPDGGYRIDYAGFDRSEVDIGGRQQDLINIKIRAAIGAALQGPPADWRMPGRLGTPYDLETLDGLRRAARGDPTVAAATLPPDRAAYVLVRAQLVPGPNGPMISLRADLLGGCQGSTTPVDLPESMVGEPYVSPEALFEGASLSLWKNRPSGSTALFLNAELDNEGAAPVEWRGYFSDLLNAGLSQAPERIGREVFLSAAPFLVNPEDGRSFDREWQAFVRVREVERGYQIFIRVDRDDSQALTERGLVNPADLPVRALDRLRGSATPAFPGATPVRPGLIPLVLQGEMARGAQPRLLSFSLARESVVELDLRDFAGPMPPRLRIRGTRGPDLPEPPSVRPNLVRYRLPAGDYAVRITNPGKGAVRFVLALRAAPGSLTPLPPQGSVLLRDFADWTVGTDVEDDGTRTCFAFTVADVMEPENWRDQRPVIWFKVVTASAAGRFGHDIEHYFDQSRFFARARVPEAIVSGTSGVRWRLGLSDVGGRLRSVNETSSGDLVMSDESLEGLTRGARLVLTGVTASGRPGQIGYSLMGYQAAINAMLGECGRDELRRRLVRR